MLRKVVKVYLTPQQRPTALATMVLHLGQCTCNHNDYQPLFSVKIFVSNVVDFSSACEGCQEQKQQKTRK